ncbi:PKD domain-containing protein, partial [Paractinoplanes toevensis]|uniref:PKD domain-containing protein n=1 Tax=Paractinoplanes toevensis TaxID=571911 RepID=UPI001FEC1820
NWGDGTSSTLPATWTAITKQYAKAGKFTVTLTLTDAAGNRTTPAPATVTVTVPGTFKLSKTAVWPGEYFNVTISSVPTGTTKIVLYTGDGFTKTLSGKNQTVAKRYYHLAGDVPVPAGTRTLTAVFTNKNGSTAQVLVGRITVKKDVWSPKVTITKPAKSTKASSWKTVRGTAADKGSGVAELLVVVLRTQGASDYCYSYQNRWIRLTNDVNVLTCFHSVKVKKGKWSLAVKGQKKNTTLDVLAVVGD